MKKIIQQFWPYLAAVAVFLVIATGYFSPVVFERKALHQNDIRQGAGMGQDLIKHQEATGERSLWSSRMFGGMPTYQMAPSYKSTSVLRTLRRAYEGWLPAPVSHVFAYMLGFFILLCALKVNPWTAVIGAIAYAFSSYFIIIIEAGHIWKVNVLTLIPPTLAGIVWAYRGKYLLGGAVTALFFAMQLSANHIQMTYYSLLFVGLFVIGRFIYDAWQKQWLSFLKASAVLLIAGAAGFGANATSMILSQKHAEQTIRGASELTDNAENRTGGLDFDYATAWSYGIGETFTLLIPDVKGGASGSMGACHPKEVQKASHSREIQTTIGQGFDSYWGNQPFTSGTIYVGAFIVCLFIFGLIVVKGYLKWVLLAGTLASIALAWGHNFMLLTNWFFDYFPMYNKFRAVSSILIVAELCIPALAVLALAKIVDNPRFLKENKPAFFISFGLTAGLALLFIMAPGQFFSFLSNKEAVDYAQYLRNPSYSSLFDALRSARMAVFCSDAWRSIVIILIGAGLLWLYSAKKIKKPLLIATLAALVLFDLANVDKRYLNNDDFVPKTATKVAWEMTPADRQILTDSDPNYRVFSLAVSPFNDASVSYYHKSIGGYHGAKLRRYQELIDRYLSKMNMNMLNMLNTRYFIIPDRENNSAPPRIDSNAMALGNAWFIDSLQVVQNADEEIAALGALNPATTAVVDVRFAGQLEGFVPQHDKTAQVELVDYKINDLTYKTTAAGEQIAVFSEIYYDDGLTRWEAFIDGQPVPHFRANYVLRALRIPAGEHTVEFVFKPKAVGWLNTVSMGCLWGIILLSLATVGWEIKRNLHEYYPTKS
ncbi:MAG: YfhO family protein [Prevotellaceae bacterium]|jgi:hypothetical protein|nr:YfhO family protein [Prevotellaceae bacterium]